MTKKSLGYVELEWTCPRCSTRNPGSSKFCNGCGAPQPDDIQFEQAVEEKILTDQEKIARAQAGPDIHCPYCGARNPGNAKFCGACGGDLTDAVARESGRVVGAHREGSAEEINCPACGTANPASNRVCSNCGSSLVKEPPKPQPAEPATAKRSLPIAAILIGALCFVVGAFAIFMLFLRTNELTGVVQNVHWERSIAIEVLGPVERDDWLDEIPSEAEVGTCSLEHRYDSDVEVSNSTEVCGTPYTVDTGSGFGEVVQDCIYEVYEDYCSYTVMDWYAEDVSTVTGSDIHPQWPTISLGTDQREGDREESYEVTFSTDDGNYTYTTTDPVEFSSFEPGSTWILNVNALGGVASVEPAK
jgi:predicted nucleic acid-binding Zn ribbon protein